MSVRIPDPLNAFVAHGGVDREGHPGGPLAGTACAVKDALDVAGVPTGFGHPAWLASHPVPQHDAEVVRRVLEAGARVVGKTHCDELCYSLNGINGHYGTPVNPRAPQRLPGGSSSGSASAVAGGLADFALGSDTGGSVRVPASYCGLYGMRPTHGAVPEAGVVPFAPSYDTVGWFAREAALFAKVGRVLLPAATGPADAPRRLLIAADAFAHAEPAACAVLAPALQRLQAMLGAGEAVTVADEGLETWMQAFRVLQGAEIWRTHRDWIGRLAPGFGGGIAERFAWVATLGPGQVEPAAALRASIRMRMERLLAGGAVLALPTTPGPAPLLETPVPALEAWRNRCLGLLCIAGHAGLPQLSLPLAQVDGAPLGLSLIAARGADAMLLSLAERLEAGPG